MRNFRVLLFDLDDTLVDSTALYDEALRASDTDAADPEYVAARRRVKQRLPGGSPQSHQRLLYFKEMEIAGGRWTAEAVLRRTERYEKALRAGVQRRWQELRRSALFSMWHDQYGIGILTNETTRTQLIKLEAMDPEGRFFDHLFTSEECGFEKPDRRMFEWALETFGVGAGECLMVGDSFENDCRPALELGMRAVHTREFRTPPESGRAPLGCPSIDALSELGSILA